jgi:hypothetical protein
MSVAPARLVLHQRKEETVTQTPREARLAEAREKERAARQALADAQARRAALEAIANYKEPVYTGAVIRWVTDFGGREYTYVAVNAAGAWYSTAQKGPASQVMSWEELQDIWENAGRHLIRLEVVTAYKPLETEK